MIGFNFDFKQHRGKYDAMICIGQEERDLFSQFLSDHGRQWCTGKSYLAEKMETFGTDGGCIFAFNDGSYWSSKESFENNRRNGSLKGDDLYFKDFYFSEDTIEFTFDELFE